MGFFIFQYCTTIINHEAVKEFPSPIGVLYISIEHGVIEADQERNVSVPYWGSLYFNDVSSLFIMRCMAVSVPYWGSLYFNPIAVKADSKIELTVSVPYWGSLYFNYY